MDARPAIENLCCLNPECKQYGQRGQNNLMLRKTYGADRIRYLRCHSCGEEFSERKGTALFNCKIGEARAVSIIEHLDSGCGHNATARLVHVSKDAVRRLTRLDGRISRQLHDRLVGALRLRAVQFDEKWSYVGKKQAHLTVEDDPEETGDYWDANALDPQSKLLISLVPGKRTAETIHQVVADAAQRLATDAPLPALFTDGEPTYLDAIRDGFGRRYPVPRSSRYGRPPDPIVRIPRELVYAQVVKHRQGGKVTQVEIRPIFGKGKLPDIVAQLGWEKANTSAIERYNLTDRMRNGRKARKTIGFSRRACFHDAMSWISALRYNSHHAHRTLKQRTEEGCWQERTPAMAAGLADHLFSTLELMHLCPIGLG
jgi:IS1 family transposase/transposase-like protein